jgi:hypothetical protein
MPATNAGLSVGPARQTLLPTLVGYTASQRARSALALVLAWNRW